MGRSIDIQRTKNIQTRGAHTPSFHAPTISARRFATEEQTNPEKNSKISLCARGKKMVSAFIFRLRRTFLRSQWSERVGMWRNRSTVFEYRIRVAWHRFSSKHRLLAPGSFAHTALKPVRVSILLALIIGMTGTHLIEGVINKNASADRDPVVAGADTESHELSPDDVAMLLEKAAKEENFSNEKPFELSILSDFIEEDKQEKFEEEVRRLVKGYPIEEMLPYIFEKDRITATFLIGIGKKESNWGRRVPVLDGQDCYNYWGFREKRRLMGTGGHTCFNSRKDAVDSVAHRIEKLIFEYERDTPKEMIIWKCGYSCTGHSPESVRKWIADVEGYYKKLNEIGEE